MFGPLPPNTELFSSTWNVELSDQRFPLASISDGPEVVTTVQLGDAACTMEGIRIPTNSPKKQIVLIKFFMISFILVVYQLHDPYQ